jgi:gliding motility-associated-like protein
MVKYLFAFLGLFASYQAEAMLYGGYILYRQLAENTYEITIHRYDDCDDVTSVNGNTRYFDSYGYLIYHDLFGNYLYEQDTSETQLPSMSSLQYDVSYSAIDTLYNDCKVPNPNICVQHYIYVDTLYTEIPPGGLYIVHGSTRSPFPVNSTDFQSLIFYTYIPDNDIISYNSSPTLSTEMPWYFCLNEMGHRSLDFEDPDGDSLSVEFYQPYAKYFGSAEEYPLPNPISEFTHMLYSEGYGPDIPIPGNPGLSINPQTFELSCNPSETGAYVMGIKVTEYRNGIEIAHTLYDLAAFSTNCGVIQAIFDSPECSGLEIEFENLSTSSDHFIWNFGGIENTSTDTNPTVQFPAAGEYPITLIAQPGSCADTLVQTIVVSPPVNAEFSTTDIDCSSGNYEISVLPDGQWPDDASFNWLITGGTPSSSNELNPGTIILSPDQTANFSFEVTNGWCTSLSTLSIDIPAFPEVEILNPPDPCTGLDYTCTANASGAEVYHWQIFQDGELLGQFDESDPMFSFPQEGNYTIAVEIQSLYGCMAADYVEFSISSNAPILANYGLVLPGECDNSQVISGTWLGSNATHVYWDMGDGTYLEADDFSHEYASPGLYTLTLHADNAPCYDEYTEEVEVLIYSDVAEAREYFVPNVFTPNSDDQNALFSPSYRNQPGTVNTDWNDITEVYELVVFDRNGNKVFESTSSNAGWDGRYKGNDVPAGTYFYSLKVKFSCDESIQETSGYVTLLR